jgi:alpha-galactosidase
MMGGDLPTTSPETIALLTNPEVLAVLNNSSGARQVVAEDETIAWTAQGESGQTYVAVFNLSDEVRAIRLPWQRLGLQPPGQVRDLWSRADRQGGPELDIDLPAHGSALLAVG